MVRPTAVVTIFRALADETRLRLFSLMGKDEICVCYLVEILGSSQPKISRHLAYLRRAGLVAARREGKWMHYRVTSPGSEGVRRILNAVRSWLNVDSEMEKDRQRLARICCSARKPAAVDGAPTPARFRDAA
ncbi:MAG: metalloregulator ArsR/SmtB family transcription factor [Verrucomicrobiota bacterium]|nr:metalloregulator ArsR/SmtB family transcription factor [Verrucomicrobiota bacterium]